MMPSAPIVDVSLLAVPQESIREDLVRLVGDPQVSAPLDHQLLRDPSPAGLHVTLFEFLFYEGHSMIANAHNWMGSASNQVERAVKAAGPLTVISDSVQATGDSTVLIVRLEPDGWLDALATDCMAAMASPPCNVGRATRFPHITLDRAPGHKGEPLTVPQCAWIFTRFAFCLASQAPYGGFRDVIDINVG